MKRNLILTLITLFALNLVFAQTAKQKRADKLYAAFAYVKASALYEDLAKQNIANTQSLKNMADCYNRVGDTKKAEQWYKVLYDKNEASTEEIYNYAQALKANGKLNDADLVLQKFYSAKPGDSRAEEFSKKKDAFAKMQNEKPYFSLANIEGNSVEADFSPTYYKDKVVFISGRKKSLAVKNLHTWNEHPFLDIYTASKDDKNNLSNITAFNKKTNSRYHEGPVCYTADGNTMYFTRNNYFKKKYKKSKEGVNMLELFRSKFVDGKWNEEKLNIDNDEYSVGHPTLSADEKTLYFVSDMPGGIGGTDIYKAEIKADGSIGTPVNLGKPLNTEGNEMFPYMHKNGTLFFSSNGHLGFGEQDVFAAMADKQGNYNKIMNLGAPLNSGKDDFGFVLDANEKMGYVSSNRDGGKGDDDIYSVTMLRPLKQTYLVKGIAYEKGTKNPLSGSTVALQDGKGSVIGMVTTDASGAYEFEVEQQLPYTLTGNKEKYFDDKNLFSTSEMGDNTELIKDLYLEKDPGMALRALVTDGKTGAPLDGVKMKITDLKSGQVFIQDVTPGSGDLMKALADKKLNDALSYKIELQKQGYFPKEVTFNYIINKPGIINVHEALAGSLVMDREVTDIRELVVINDIRFDLNKFNIRTDAAMELDKVVAVMNKYPNMVVELGSHTDCRASIKYNATLSDKRAKASAAYIKSKITNPDRIYGKGYGESKLLNDCACEGAVKSTCSEEEHQKNRRTEFKIISMGTDKKVDVQNNSTNSFGK